MQLNTKEPPQIDVNGEDLKCTSSFTFLGSTVTSKGGDGKDIRCRLGKARGTFIKRINIWKFGQIGKNTKMTAGYYMSTSS